MSQPLRVVYVVSRAHSGSTLLDLLLGTHPEVFSVGEAKMFAQESEKLCTCGAERWDACEFWSAVDARMRADGGSGVAQAAIESDEAALFGDYNRRFFSAVAAQSGSSVIVDSSKDYTRLRRFLKSDLEPRVLHLVRSPRGVAFSNMRKGGRLGRECRTYVREHLAALRALRGRPHLEVRYEDLARNPAGELERILSWLGLVFDPAQLAGWKGHERHNFGGNRMRFSSSEEIHLDEAWREGLSCWQQVSILMRTLPARVRWGPLVGLMHRLFVGRRDGAP